MNTFKLAFRKLFRKGEYTLTRIISLVAGLTFGIILLSEVLYYYSFDGFYPDADRIYIVYENFNIDQKSNHLESNNMVSGAIAPGLKANVPGIEVATRFNSIGSSIFYTVDQKSYKAKFSLADEFAFDVLPRPMINGNAKDILSTPMQCMISDKIARKMGNNVIGQTIELKEYPNKILTIAGVFKSLPENTYYEYDILISMVSTKDFMWDGTENWLGNDRYYSAVKLAPGVDPKSLAPAVRKMQETYQDILEIEKEDSTFVFKYTFFPIKQIFSNEVKDMIIILTLIAFAVLFVSLLNYIMLTLSSLINRTKSSAIFKCYGAQAKQLQGMVLTETMLIYGISLVLTFFMILFLKTFVEQQVGHQLVSVLNPTVVLPIIGLLTIIVFVIGYFPGKFYASIPVASAFRNFRQKSNRWKLALLSVQFVGASFIATLLVVVSMQYNKMITEDHGYQSKNIFYGSTTGMDSHKVNTVLQELRQLPEIEVVGMGVDVPVIYPSGNNVMSPEENKELFNVADFYYIDDNYLNILNIPVIQGNNFTRETASINDVLISKKGADMLALYNNWTDGVIGKPIVITEHQSDQPSTIRGIYPDFVINSLASTDKRPSVFFYMPEEVMQNEIINRPSSNFIILAKAKDGQSIGMIKKMSDIFNLALPHNDAVIKNLEQEQINNYQAEKGFHNAMKIGNIIIVIITLLGLLGYTTGEANRRKKDLAIRKINGARLKDLLQMFIWQLERLAIPSVIIGLLGAWYLSGKWQEQFTVKAELSWWILVLICMGVLLFIALIAGINYFKTANKNPIQSLRYE